MAVPDHCQAARRAEGSCWGKKKKTPSKQESRIDKTLSFQVVDAHITERDTHRPRVFYLSGTTKGGTASLVPKTRETSPRLSAEHVGNVGQTAIALPPRPRMQTPLSTDNREGRRRE